MHVRHCGKGACVVALVVEVEVLGLDRGRGQEEVRNGEKGRNEEGQKSKRNTGKREQKEKAPGESGLGRSNIGTAHSLANAAPVDVHSNHGDCQRRVV